MLKEQETVTAMRKIIRKTPESCNCNHLNNSKIVFFMRVMILKRMVLGSLVVISLDIPVQRKSPRAMPPKTSEKQAWLYLCDKHRQAKHLPSVQKLLPIQF